MAEAVETMDGWYCLHDLWTFDWEGWKKTSIEKRRKIMKEFQQIVHKWEEIEGNKEGSHVIHQVIGQKADLLLMILRPTMEEIANIDLQIRKSSLSAYLIPAYSYISIVEISKYREKKGGTPPEQLPQVQRRLQPILPKWNYICFYPMSRRRKGEENWYTLAKDQRAKLLYEHGMTGSKYSGKVKQLVTGSIGLDEYEWAVTLFSEEVLQFKKIVYEMRFDEATAKYGEFANFYIGRYLGNERLQAFFALE